MGHTIVDRDKRISAHWGGKRSLFGGKRSLFGLIRGCNEDVAHTSFSEDHLWVSGVFFNFTAQAVDILLNKFRVSSVIWPPDSVE